MSAMNGWKVQCQVEYTTKDGNTEWHGSRQVPTFWLNPHVVGTNRETLDRIIRDIVDPMSKADKVHISAVLV